MAKTHFQFWEIVRRRVREIVFEVLRDEEVFNSRMWLDGKVASVAADNKHANVYINGSTVATQNIPIANGLTLVANDEVVVLNRAKMRDLIILYKKVL